MNVRAFWEQAVASSQAERSAQHHPDSPVIANHVLYSDPCSHSAPDSSIYLQWNIALLFQAVHVGAESGALCLEFAWYT